MAKIETYLKKKVDSFMEEYNPDEYDRRIIRILSQDGRASYTEIANILRVTPATIRNRIKNLKERGIIKKIIPLINKKLYHLDISALFMISLESSKITEDIVSHLKEFPEITQISILANNPNIVCTIVAENMEVFSVLLTNVTQLDGVKDIQANFIIKTISSGYFIQ
ncbi:MAG: Lrp/AsnC family transcriptional regulator [Promethearchaeota archaeon]